MFYLPKKWFYYKNVPKNTSFFKNEAVIFGMKDNNFHLDIDIAKKNILIQLFDLYLSPFSCII